MLAGGHNRNAAILSSTRTGARNSRYEYAATICAMGYGEHLAPRGDSLRGTGAAQSSRLIVRALVTTAAPSWLVARGSCQFLLRRCGVAVFPWKCVAYEPPPVGGPC
eukprot:COSAG01_NODE_2450_length_7674_cov_86.009109_8_plen_107_part_00